MTEAAAIEVFYDPKKWECYYKKTSFS